MAWGSSGTGNLPAPTLTAPANGATGVALSPAFSWSAVTGNNGYRIMIATSPADLPTNPATTTCSACTVVDTTSANSNSYTPPSALAAGAYYWQVQAIEPSSSSGTAAWSNIFSFTTTGATLAAPTLTAPANGATAVSLTAHLHLDSGHRECRLSNIDCSDAKRAAHKSCGRDLRRLRGRCDDHGGFLHSCRDALAGSTTYYWEVQALAPSGSGQNGTWSSVSNFTTVRCGFFAQRFTQHPDHCPRKQRNVHAHLDTRSTTFPRSLSFTCSVPQLARRSHLLGRRFRHQQHGHGHHHRFFLCDVLSGAAPRILASAAGGWPAWPCFACC